MVTESLSVPLQKTVTSKLTSKSSGPRSKVLFSFLLPDSIKQKLANETYNTILREVHPKPSLLPASCACGGAWKTMDEKHSTEFLYFSCGRVFCTVFNRRCEQNICVQHYDGSEDGIFHYSDYTLVFYSLLLEYFASMATGKITWNSFTLKKEFEYNHAFCNADKYLPFIDARTWELVCIYWFLYQILISIGGFEF